MSFKIKYEITSKFITSNTDRRPSIKIQKVRFSTAHDSGNPGATALDHYKFYMNTLNGNKSSAQIFVDDVHILELIPAFKNPEKAYHVMRSKPKDNELFGCDAIDVSIGTELCYGGKINNLEAYKRYVWVHAYLCYLYGLNIRKHIIGHYKLDPKRRTDPIPGLKSVGKTFEQFINDVEKEYAECTQLEGEGMNEEVRQILRACGTIIEHLVDGESIEEQINWLNKNYEIYKMNGGK